MKVSLNTIKNFTDVDVTVDVLVEKINTQLGKVETVIDLHERYKDVVIAKIVSCEKHPNADKLNVCMIEVGKEKPVQVVCGAPNVKEGLLVAWLPPGSIVPASYTDDEPFVLGERELRGVMSHGMLASPKELSIGDSHDGILEIEDDIRPGTSFAKQYGLNDTILDIENKMFTHRPDCFGQLGVAREIAGIMHQQFVSPDWYRKLPSFQSGEGLTLTVTNNAGTVVPRFMAVAIKNVNVKQSPLWLQTELVRLGSKPINNIVDITNYVMLMTGQPLHAYDYDLLEGGKLGTRYAKKGEKAGLLNGKVYELHETDIVIEDGAKIVGLGGVMGGGNSEVSDMTINIVLECATFDMYAIRKTSMRHGLFTDAVTRFNKGQSPLQNEAALARAMHYITELTGGELASQVFDAHGQKTLSEPSPVQVTPSFVNDRLGVSFTGQQIKQLLTNVECSVQENTKSKHGSLQIFPPFWRNDLELPEDIVEEVGRLYGFDALPKVLPERTLKPGAQNQELILRQTLRENLCRFGANEVLTYSFVHEKVMTRAGQDPSHAYRIANALSPDLQYYRMALMPSLLDKVHMNYKAGYKQFALFEIGKVHYKGEMDEREPDVPTEDTHVALILTGGDDEDNGGAAYYRARYYLEQLLSLDGVKLQSLDMFDLTTDEWGAQLTAAYEPTRSAVIVKDKQVWGVIGEFRNDVETSFKLPAFTAGFELHADLLKQAPKEYKAISKFPSVRQDLSLKVPRATRYGDVYEAVQKAVATSAWHVTTQPLSIYQSETDHAHKTISLRFTVTSYSDTLTDKEVSLLLQQVVRSLAALGATQA